MSSIHSRTRSIASVDIPEDLAFLQSEPDGGGRFEIGGLADVCEDGTPLAPLLLHELSFSGLPSPPGWPILPGYQPGVAGLDETSIPDLEMEAGEALSGHVTYPGSDMHLGPVPCHDRLGWVDMSSGDRDLEDAIGTAALGGRQGLTVPTSLVHGRGAHGPTGGSSPRRPERPHRRRRRYPQYSEAGILRGAEQSLSTATNNSLISESLMRIYHDVFEGALSCWLTEQTCPYKMTSIPTSGGGPCLQSEPMAQEWGLSWSNRILRRVLKLDAVAENVGLRRAPPGERQAGTRALQLAILAFATQWSQAGEGREDQRPPALGAEAGFLTGFGRAIQTSFWHQARRALDDCRDSDSFTVAYAELIFGLTQKSSDGEEGRWDGETRPAYDAEVDTLSLMNEALQKDTAYVYLERATRRLHVLKRLVESSGRRGRSAVDPEDGKTIGLVYWLAMMFDTLSSAMTERPLSVQDQEIWETVLPDERVMLTPTGWEDPQSLSPHACRPPRWPCSESDAARQLVEAAPVKVLLFRKVAHIQKLVFGCAAPRMVDETIQDALRVLRHWNNCYGALFDDLIEHHESLPPRIQSWYVCLLGHWLLGALLLADLMDDIHGGEAGGRERSLERDMVADQIRWTSVHTISALARASMPLRDRNLPCFHSSVSESALLTEPWTAVLIRTFSYAGALLLDTPTTTPREGLDLCEPCIGALRHLGRKSDLSRQLADMLGARLRIRGAQRCC